MALPLRRPLRKMPEMGSLIAGSLCLGATALYGAYYYWLRAPSLVPPALSGTYTRYKLSVKTLTRCFHAYVPPNLKPGAALVIALHGSTMDGKTFRSWTGRRLDQLADQRGFAVAYPDGLKNLWSDNNKSRPYEASFRAQIDEPSFIHQLIEQLHHEYGISLSRVYFLGYSNGAGLALTMILDEPSSFQGAATFACQLPTPDNRLSNPPYQPLPPLFLCNGTDDPIVPFDGGEMKILGLFTRGHALSFDETRRELLARNGLDADDYQLERTACASSSPEGSVKGVDRYAWSRDGKEVVVAYEILGGGHSIPRPGARFGPRVVGATCLDFDALEKAIDFFGL